MKRRTSQFLSILVALCMALSLLPGTILAAEVASGTCGDNLTWTLTDDGTLTISGNGAMYDYIGNHALWYEQRNAITAIDIGDGVTTIGANAFWMCDSLISVTIPNSVVTIRSCAFSGCGSLTSVNIPNSVVTIEPSTFNSCHSLTNVTIGNSVTSIELGTFEDCSSLTSLAIPDSVTAIGPQAFYMCNALSELLIPNSVTNIEWEAFDGCDSLTDVYYGGSQNQWENIAIGVTNDPLYSATIHYNDDASDPVANGSQSSDDTWNNADTVNDGNGNKNDIGAVDTNNSSENNIRTTGGAKAEFPVVLIVIIAAVVVAALIMVLIQHKKKKKQTVTTETAPYIDKAAPSPVEKRDSSASGSARFCPKCGYSIKPGANFCSKCGHNLMEHS